MADDEPEHEPEDEGEGWEILSPAPFWVVSSSLRRSATSEPGDGREEVSRDLSRQISGTLITPFAYSIFIGGELSSKTATFTLDGNDPDGARLDVREGALRLYLPIGAGRFSRVWGELLARPRSTLKIRADIKPYGPSGVPATGPGHYISRGTFDRLYNVIVVVEDDPAAI